MKITGKTPCKLKKVILQGSQDSSTFHFDDSQGPPKEGIWFHVEPAASSVARESAVSFSPPQRPPPRPSNDHRKRKETVAAVGDDDDDFVGVPPRTSASCSKPTTAPVRKVKKSKSSHAGPQPSEIVVGDGFDNLSSSQQAAFMDDVFGNPDNSQSPCNSPNESPYESPHEILTNGVCKTCHDIDESCKLDEELLNEEGDADPSAADKAIDAAEEVTEPSCHRPQVDADAAGQMASPRTARSFCTPRNVISDSSFRGHQTESTPLPPPVFDETPNLHHRSLTPSQQLRDAGLQEMATLNKLPHIPAPVFDETPEHHRHDSKNMKQGFVSAQTLFDRPNAFNR